MHPRQYDFTFTSHRHQYDISSMLYADWGHFHTDIRMEEHSLIKIQVNIFYQRLSSWVNLVPLFACERHCRNSRRYAPACRFFSICMLGLRTTFIMEDNVSKFWFTTYKMDKIIGKLVD